MTGSSEDRIFMPEDYERLGEHLKAIDPILERFCQRHGFYRQLGGLGRYPRRRIERTGDFKLFFALGMELTPENKRFTEFFPEIPYHLVFGGGFDEGESRYFIRLWAFHHKPFSRLPNELEGHLEDGLSRMASMSREYLRANGQVRRRN
jgi:hypothetical protein